MTMKENQNATFYDSKSFRRETDPLTFGSKEIYESDDSGMTVDPLAFETNVRDENRKDIDDISMDNGSGTIDSPRKNDQNGPSDHVRGWEKDSDTLSSDMYDKDKKQIIPEPESSVTVEEFTLCNGNEYRDSSSQCDGASDLFETVTNVFTDKNVLECELPELEVMKDICVDSGTPENDKKLLESFKDDNSAHLLPQNPNSHNDCEAKEASTLENGNGHTANQCEIKEDNDGKLVDQEWPKASSVSASEKDTAKQSVLRTFLDSLDGEGNKLTQPPHQIPIEKAVSEGPASGGLEESGSITFKFSDTGQVQCTTSRVDLHEQSLIVKDKNVSSKNSNDENVCEQQDDNSDDLSSDGQQVHSPSDKSQCSTNDDVPAVEPNDAKQERGNSGNDSAVSQWQYEQGEMSFSAVTYSGQIAFSGSLSHRSDASTTSARSFAFPVLQSEWNSSPVRMAKADRRHFRKQKGWRSGLLCCRF